MRHQVRNKIALGSLLLVCAADLIVNPIGGFFWVFIALAAALIVGWIAQDRFLKSYGKCPNCGYDLRGSRGRCPECGKLIPPGVSR